MAKLNSFKVSLTFPINKVHKKVSWLWSTDEYGFKNILSESPSLIMAIPPELHSVLVLTFANHNLKVCVVFLQIQLMLM